MDYQGYSLRRDANTVAKFLARMTAHREKLAFHRFSPETAPFPKPPTKNSKYPAYEAADRLANHFGFPRPSSVPELAAVLSKALDTLL